MVIVSNYKQMTTQDGKSFFMLELQGDMEMVKSNATGKYYATARTANVSTTFDERVCAAMIGKELPGAIRKVECEPYEYVIPSTGEKVELTYSWTYVPD